MNEFSKEIYIGNKKLSQDESAYIIAEIGSNHDQSLSKAKELIDAAWETGADAAKFQSLNFNALYQSGEIGQDIKDLFKLIELSEEWYSALAKHCEKRGIHFLSAPTYLEAVKLLDDVGSPAFKIASPQFDLYPEITLEAKKFNKPLIMSTGLSSLGDIDKMMMLCSDENIKDIVLLHCVSQYPTIPENANLGFISTLKNLYGCLVGYSDHTLGIHFPVSAVALGAKVIEKHFTLNKNSSGPDHHFASEPNEFKAMVEQIKEIETGLGSGGKPQLTEWEKGHKKRIAMKFISKRCISAGSPFKIEDFVLKRGDGGIERGMYDVIKSFSIKKDIPEGTMLEWQDIEKKG